MRNHSLRLLLLSTFLLIAIPLGAQSVLPTWTATPKAEQILTHEGFTVSYNNKTRCPNWVAWELTPEEAASEVTGRTDFFTTDPLVKGPQAEYKDYSRNNFRMDRGHMAPSADFRWSITANEQTFYLTNICPQDHTLNEGLWLELEQRCRAYAKRYGTNVDIICGPLFKNGYRRYIGSNLVRVPDGFFKAIRMTVRQKTYLIAFIFPNHPLDAQDDIFNYTVTAQEFIERTGLIPFPEYKDISTEKGYPWNIPWKKPKKK